MTSERLKRIVLDSIARVARLDPADVHEDVNLVGLGLDSLAFSSILVEIEDAVGEEVPAEILDRLGENDEIVYVRDVLRLLDGWDPPIAVG